MENTASSVAREGSPAGNYAALLAQTRAALAARVAGTSDGPVLAEYFARGKMMRATVVFAASASVGGDPALVQDAAEAVELLHGASLFHDDIIDGAATRRGLPALHERLDIGRALVLGDELFFCACAALSEAHLRHPPMHVLQALQVLSRCARDCCRGQFRELSAAPWIAVEEYLAIVRGKTAAPFVAAGMLGAILGGGSCAQLESLRRYAEHVGIVFQITDDVLDLIGDPVAAGKPVGNSLARGRPTLPLLYLWHGGSDAVKEDARRLAASGWPRQPLLALLTAQGVLPQVRETQARHIAAALEALDGVEQGVGRDALGTLAIQATELVTPSAAGSRRTPRSGK